MILALAGAVGIVGAATVAVAFVQTRAAGQAALPAAPVSGVVMVDSGPRGAEVIIDGKVEGVTPVQVPVSPGQHSLEVRSGTVTRMSTLDVRSGTLLSHHVEFAPETKPMGRLEVASEPAGARVTIDGVSRGTTPVTIPEIAAGTYNVVISSGNSSVTRSVAVAGGASSSVFASVAPAGSAGGWIALTAPIALNVLEDGRLLGRSDVDRLMLPAGRHELELVNADLGFRTTVSIDVAPGRTATRAVPMPNGTLSINALPWANVWIDGKPVGITPLGNLSVPIGSHDIIWRHPQLGERRRTISVPATSPVRLGMDFSQ
jgi:hypothetical protein